MNKYDYGLDLKFDEDEIIKSIVNEEEYHIDTEDEEYEEYEEDYNNEDWSTLEFWENLI